MPERTLSKQERNSLRRSPPSSSDECKTVVERYESTIAALEEDRDHWQHAAERLRVERETAFQEIRRLSDALGFYAKNWDTWGKIAKRALGADKP